MLIVQIVACIVSELRLEEQKYGKFLNFIAKNTVLPSSEIICRHPVAKNTSLKDLKAKYHQGQRLQLFGRLNWSDSASAQMFVSHVSIIKNLSSDN